MAVERGTSGRAVMGSSPRKSGDSLELELQLLRKICLLLLIFGSVLHQTQATPDQKLGLLSPYESGSGALLEPDSSFGFSSGAVPTESANEIPTESVPLEG